MKVSELINALLQFDQDAEICEFEGNYLRPTRYEPEMVGINDKDKECSFDSCERTGVILSRG